METDDGPDRDQVPGTVALGFGGLDVEPGAHVGHFYQSDEERRELLRPFLARGIRRGQRCVYLTQPKESREELLSALADDGVDVERAVEDGRLDLRGGLGEPEELERLLERNADRVPDDFPLLRWGGDLSWSREEMPDSRSLMRWESACNTFDHRRRAVFFCQYPLADFSGDVIMDALQTHPVSIVGRSVQENSLYREPEAFLEEMEERPAASFEGAAP